jgi:drug/metabolite transporter (DMT)-like permease
LVAPVSGRYAFHRERTAHLTWRDWYPLFFSVICNGARYHLDAMALQTASPLAGVVVSSLCGALSLSLAGMVWRRLGWNAASLEQISIASLHAAWQRTQWVLLASTAAGAAGGWLTLTANRQYGPAVTAFLANLTLVFLVLAGILGGEKIRWRESAGILVIVAGAFLFSYRGSTPQWDVLALMVIGCLFMAGKQLLTKKATGLMHLPSVMALSLVFVSLWGLAAGVATNTLQFGSMAAVILLAGGGVLGSVIGMSLLYVGYHRVGVTRGSAFDAMRPLPVLLISLLMGAPLPSLLQSAGAVLVITGSGLLPFLSSHTSTSPLTSEDLI